MHIRDQIHFSGAALLRYRLRTFLILLAVAIGVASIIILTGLGEGARRYVTGEFASLGTNLVIVIPGKTETSGNVPSMFIGDTPRDLTIEDAESLTRSTQVRHVAPLIIGSAQVSWQQKDREVPILGSTHELLDIRQWKLSRGRFLPAGDPERGSPICVIGNKVREELFGNENAIGQSVRIGDRQFRVIGILGSEGRSIGLDVQELVIIPVASAQSLFNAPSLFRIFVEARSREAIPRVKEQIIQTLKARHQNEEDVTVITQDAVLSTFDRILTALTLTVAGIAAISLAVAGILIMNIMLVTVSQRTAEIGLLKALGASGRQILALFLMEAILLSSTGAALGLFLGQLGNAYIHSLYPDLQSSAPLWATGAAVGVAVCTGLLFGVLPARRAARLDPVIALARK